MTRILFIGFLNLLLFQAYGVTLPFEVPAPMFRKIALGKATADNLIFGFGQDSNAEDHVFTYIYRTPSENSDVKIVDDANMKNWSVGYPDLEEWTSDFEREDAFYIPFEEGLIEEEQGAWLRIKGYGCSRGEDGWVNGATCFVRDFIKVNSDSLACFDDFLPLECEQDNKGEYLLYANWNDTQGIVTFLVGKIRDGVLVCPYAIACYFEENDDLTPGFYISKEGDNAVYVYNSQEWRSLVDFNPDDIKKIVNSAFEQELCNVFVFRDGREYKGDYLIRWDFPNEN